MQNSDLLIFTHTHTHTHTHTRHPPRTIAWRSKWNMYSLQTGSSLKKGERMGQRCKCLFLLPSSQIRYVIPTPLGKNEWGSKERLWPPDAKNWLIRKDPDARKGWRKWEKWTTEDEMVGWLHQLDGHESEKALGVGDGQGSLVCCSPWGHKESNKTEQLNWTELIVSCWHKSL